jgi:ribosomal protein S18 acetylase RimI-like enzyme
VLVRPAVAADARPLGELLVDVVQGGASVGFLADLTVDDAERWWAAHLGRDGLRVLVARDGDDLLGTGSLVLASMPNGRHRAEIAKLLVSPRARRRGLGRLLLGALEDAAREEGRTLLVLDTVTGSPAQLLYQSAGWSVVGVVEDYAAMPDGALAPTTFLSRRLT